LQRSIQFQSTAAVAPPAKDSFGTFIKPMSLLEKIGLAPHYKHGYDEIDLAADPKSSSMDDQYDSIDWCLGLSYELMPGYYFKDSEFFEKEKEGNVKIKLLRVKSEDETCDKYGNYGEYYNLVDDRDELGFMMDVIEDNRNAIAKYPASMDQELLFYQYVPEDFNDFENENDGISVKREMERSSFNSTVDENYFPPLLINDESLKKASDAINSKGLHELITPSKFNVRRRKNAIVPLDTENAEMLSALKLFQENEEYEYENGSKVVETEKISKESNSIKDIKQNSEEFNASPVIVETKNIESIKENGFFGDEIDKKSQRAPTEHKISETLIISNMPKEKDFSEMEVVKLNVENDVANNELGRTSKLSRKGTGSKSVSPRKGNPNSKSPYNSQLSTTFSEDKIPKEFLDSIKLKQQLKLSASLQRKFSPQCVKIDGIKERIRSPESDIFMKSKKIAKKSIFQDSLKKQGENSTEKPEIALQPKDLQIGLMGLKTFEQEKFDEKSCLDIKSYSEAELIPKAGDLNVNFENPEISDTTIVVIPFSNVELDKNEHKKENEAKSNATNASIQVESDELENIEEGKCIDTQIFVSDPLTLTRSTASIARSLKSVFDDDADESELEQSPLSVVDEIDESQYQSFDVLNSSSISFYDFVDDVFEKRIDSDTDEVEKTSEFNFIEEHNKNFFEFESEISSDLTSEPVSDVNIVNSRISYNIFPGHLFTSRLEEILNEENEIIKEYVSSTSDSEMKGEAELLSLKLGAKKLKCINQELEGMNLMVLNQNRLLKPDEIPNLEQTHESISFSSLHQKGDSKASSSGEFLPRLLSGRQSYDCKKKRLLFKSLSRSFEIDPRKNSLKLYKTAPEKIMKTEIDLKFLTEIKTKPNNPNEIILSFKKDLNSSRSKKESFVFENTSIANDFVEDVKICLEENQKENETGEFTIPDQKPTAFKSNLSNTTKNKDQTLELQEIAQDLSEQITSTWIEDHTSDWINSNVKLSPDEQQQNQISKDYAFYLLNDLSKNGYQIVQKSEFLKKRRFSILFKGYIDTDDDAALAIIESSIRQFWKIMRLGIPEHYQNHSFNQSSSFSPSRIQHSAQSSRQFMQFLYDKGYLLTYIRFKSIK
jgi:hypothetical protein